MAMLKTPPAPYDHRRGDPDAPIVLVEYGDYQCPYCAQAEPVVDALLASFEGDLQLVFRHFPLTEVHPMAEFAAQAAEFAGGRRMFWEMHAGLFANQPQLSLAVIFAIAADLGLPQDGLREALAGETCAPKVRQDYQSGVDSGVEGTPCFFVGGVRHDGPISFEALATAILSSRSPGTPGAGSPHPRA
ncbi:DsbA family protein [Phenylobacterium sp. LjRoot219]|uniref:DsbA family protein n=1 Tax=Phenylobacterium sp. LjRoot219 TaxID=3342283 RepID=UPI003ECCA279